MDRWLAIALVCAAIGCADDSGSDGTVGGTGSGSATGVSSDLSVGSQGVTSGPGTGSSESTDGNDSDGATMSDTSTDTMSDTETDTTAGSSTGDTVGEPTACGDDLVCTGSEACVQEVFPASCVAYDPKTEACGPDEVAGQCGGVGFPCCCGPTPPSEFSCESAPSCAGAPNCECLGRVCAEGKACSDIDTKGGTHVLCEPLPRA